jgi:hypothetical protein
MLIFLLIFGAFGRAVFLNAGTPPFGVVVLFGLRLCGGLLGAVYGCDCGIRLTKKRNIEGADESFSVDV